MIDSLHQMNQRRGFPPLSNDISPWLRPGQTVCLPPGICVISFVALGENRSLFFATFIQVQIRGAQLRGLTVMPPFF